jgi:hypothetical protein
MIDETIRLQNELAKAEQNLADAERLRPSPAYGGPLGTEPGAQANIERLRAVRDMRKGLLEKRQAISGSALPTAVTQQARAALGDHPPKKG